MIDLQKFCSRDQWSRPYLMKPFSVGEFSYATNGHIMVRVAQRDDVPEIDAIFKIKPGAFEKPLVGFAAATFSAPQFTLPDADADKGECPHCNGRGTVHECPDCSCGCEECDRSGTIGGLASVMVCGAPFRLHYVRLMLALPGIKIAPTAWHGEPFHFSFAEGVGALMAMRAPYDVVVDVVPIYEAA